MFDIFCNLKKDEKVNESRTIPKFDRNDENFIMRIDWKGILVGYWYAHVYGIFLKNDYVAVQTLST